MDVFAVYQSDGEDDDCMFEEEIQAAEAEYDVDSYAMLKEEEIDEENSLNEDDDSTEAQSARLASDSFSY